MGNAEISVQVVIDVARVLHQLAPPTTDSRELEKLQEELGVSLEPTFPGTQAPDLVIWFTTTAPDTATVDRLTDRLLSSRLIDAAFFKPPGELP